MHRGQTRVWGFHVAFSSMAEEKVFLCPKS